MTLAAPKSRQGKFVLVLAFLAAVVAVLAVLSWSTTARADITSVVATANDDAGASIAQGQFITYTVTVDVTGAVGGTTTNTLLTFNGDNDLGAYFDGATFSGTWTAGECTEVGSGNGDVTCTDAAGPVADSTVTFDFIAQGPGAIDPPTCSVSDDGTGSATCDVSAISTVTVNAGVTVASATNFPGLGHTFQFTLGEGFTCQSDGPPPSVPDGDEVDCVAGDVAIGGTAGCTVTSGPTVTDPDTDDTSFVSVTIDGGTGVEGTCTVTLDVYFVGNSETDPSADFDPASVVATKTFDVGEAAGEIRHRDDPDKATEDAAGTADSDLLEDWCAPVFSTGGYDCGILTPQDDSDDATGSFHEACIINTSLTHTTDSGFITWSIVPVAGSPLPTPVSVTEVSGSPGGLDEPCVRWSTGFTGVQNITAVYDNGVGPAITYYWDGYCVEGGACEVVEDDDSDPLDLGAGGDQNDVVVPLPLVKEWNTIDETKIVSVTGVVGDILFENTLDLGGVAADWADRDCSSDPVDAGLCDNANVDGLTLAQEATVIIETPQLYITAPATSFIDYTLGGHDTDPGGSYAGPVDGAEQTYSISGDCGSVRLENPQNGDVIILSQGDVPATVLSSDKGVGFTFVPNNNGAITTTLANADCGPSATICIDIATEEDNLFRSPPIDDAADEQICVIYTVGPPTSKTPKLAWAGQRMVLDHFWGSTDASDNLVCPYGSQENFYVLYSVQEGPGSFTAALQGNVTDVSQTGQDAIVEVNSQPQATDPDGTGPLGPPFGADPNTGCISDVIFENEGEGQNDIIAYVVDGPDLSSATPISQQVAFVIYYMKFEDATLSLVPGSRANHNDGTFTPASPLDSSTDVTEMTGTDAGVGDDDDPNVSQDVLARLRVRGWVETTNCPARDSGVGAGGEFLPANRCIFPDDWKFKAGGGVGDSLNAAADDTTADAGFAEETRPNYDIAGTAPKFTGTPQSACNSAPRAAGPFSWLDTNINGDVTASPCNDSLAPNVDGAHACLYAIGYSCREVVFPNGVINAWDAPMPPALARFTLSDSGFLRPADKDSVYTSGNLFYATHIPAEPWIAPINADLQGYQWNSWGGPGAKSGQYQYWTSLADSSAEIVSCAGESTGVFYDPLDSDECGDGTGARTGGYAWTKVYTDNHGEAMTWINGDANLSFDECASSAASAGHKIVQLNGYYCENGDLVGTSTLGASVDYPDKRKHFAIQSNEVTIEWTWGGIKEVTIEPGENAQFNYVVFHVTDRDGYCRAFNDHNDVGMDTLHPVLGERVVFTLDSSGIIFPDINGNPAADLTGGSWTTKSADVITFDSAAAVNAAIADGGLTVLPRQQSSPPDDECQAWIHISESLLNPVNVIVTAYDPEGTVTFDTIVNEPATPTPPVSPSPTPANQANLWADIDCSGEVNPVDSLKMLRADAGLSVAQDANCPDPGTAMTVIWDSQSTDEKWGDADCSDALDPVDSLKVLRFDAGLFYIQQEPCPDIGAEVLIPQQ